MERKQVAQEIMTLALNVSPSILANSLVTNMHPTEQQNFMNLAVHFIVEMSKKTVTDQRNFCAVEKAKRIVEKMDYTDKEGECPFI